MSRVLQAEQVQEAGAYWARVAGSEGWFVMWVSSPHGQRAQLHGLEFVKIEEPA